MRRIQVYLDDDLLHVLHLRAHESGVSVSELVREALRDRLLGNLDKRRNAMEAFVGIRRDQKDEQDSTAYVREMRRGSRLDKAQS